MHKKVIRNIIGSGYNSHTEPILHKLGLLNLKDLYKLNITTFAFKFQLELHPNYIMETLAKIKYNNRSHQFNIEKQRFAYFKLQFPYLVLNTWNQTNIAHNNLCIIKDAELKTNANRIDAFKDSLKSQLFNNYQIKVKCSNKYCTDCSNGPSPHSS